MNLPERSYYHEFAYKEDLWIRERRHTPDPLSLLYLLPQPPHHTRPAEVFTFGMPLHPQQARLDRQISRQVIQERYSKDGIVKIMCRICEMLGYGAHLCRTGRKNERWDSTSDSPGPGHLSISCGQYAGYWGAYLFTRYYGAGRGECENALDVIGFHGLDDVGVGVCDRLQRVSLMMDSST